MPNFIYDIIPPGIKRKAEATVQEVSRWFKIFKLFLKTSKYGTIVLIIGIVVFGAILVFAFSQSGAETIEVFPTQVSGDPPVGEAGPPTGEAGWQNKENAFQRELSEEAALAEFSSENSANLFGKEPIQPVEELKETEGIEKTQEPEEITSESMTPESEEQIEQPEEVLGESNEIASESVPQEINEEQPNSSPEQEQEQVPESQDETQGGETDLNYLEFLKQVGVAIGGEEIISVSENLETENLESPQEQQIEENPIENIPSESEIKEDADKLLNLIEQNEEMPSISEPNLIMHSLVFSGFESEKLGEINRAQLAFSWAAEKRETNEILLVEYKLSDSEWKTLFLIQLNTEEHSNFSNNGYWKKEIPEILSWEDVSSLEVRFTLQSIDFESQLPIYLDAIWLEVEFDEKVEELATEILPKNAELKTRKLEKEIRLDNNSSFKCGAEPFTIHLSEDSAQRSTVILRKKGEDNLLEIGNLPIGIDIRFVENNDYLLSMAGRDKVEIEIYSQVGSQKGNFSVPILYYPEGEEDPATICQINIISQ